MRPSARKKKNKYSSERLHGPLSKPNKKSEAGPLHHVYDYFHKATCDKKGRT